MNIVSFLAPRRDHPRWNDIYFDLLEILDRSCRRLGLRHVVLTDDPDMPTQAEKFVVDLPDSLMQAATTAHWKWLDRGDWGDGDTCFVGADCVVLADPTPHLAGHDMAVTYRDKASRYPINTGLMYVSANARERARALYKRIADRTGTTWCDDQRAIQAELDPMPDKHGVYDRAMMRVGFIPMNLFNERPQAMQRMPGRIMLHFRGRLDRKQQMVEWAAKWLK